MPDYLFGLRSCSRDGRIAGRQPDRAILTEVQPNRPPLGDRGVSEDGRQAACVRDCL